MDGEDDKRHLYDAQEQEMRDYEGPYDEPSAKGNLQIKYISRSGWRVPVVIALLLFGLALVLIIILQGVAIAHLNILPVVCPGSSPTSAPVEGTTIATDRPTNNDDSLSMQMLAAQMEQLVNMSYKIQTTSNEHFMLTQNNSERLDEILETTQMSAQKLTEIANSLSGLNDNSISTEAISNDILSVVQELLQLQNDSLASYYSTHLPSSCQVARDRHPDSASGYYHINGESMYCEMGELCGIDGGWTRLGYLDMADSSATCPEEYELYTFSGIRACGRSKALPATCVSVKLPSNGISYSSVCGRVTGYQYATPNAIDKFNGPGHNDLDSSYVDGVSITRGDPPRKHVWTLMAGISDSVYDSGNCPCNTPPGANQEIPSFIGNDYFCESGNPGGVSYTWFPNDPLWDGKGCGLQETDCCEGPSLSPPWFYKSFNTTADYIEVRDCGDQHSPNEDNPISFYEIYVR